MKLQSYPNIYNAWYVMEIIMNSKLKFPNIRALREENGLTQEDLSKILNVSQVAYSYYEIGRRDIPTAVLILMADYYGCSIDYLLGRSDVR